MEKMVSERRDENIAPVLDEYGSANPRLLSTQLVWVMCIVLLFFIIAMFLPIQSQALLWTRAGFVVTAILSTLAIVFDRSTHLKR